MVIPLAGCVIKDDAGRVLLIHRNTERLVQWELPGGKIEPGENLQSAAIREVYEEAGLRVHIIREIGTADFDDNGRTWEYHWFEAEITAGEPTIGEPDRYDGIGFFDILTMEHELISINVVNLVKAVRNDTVTL